MVKDWKKITIMGCEGEVIRAVAAMMANQAKFFPYASLQFLFFRWEEVKKLTILCCDRCVEAMDIQDRLQIAHGAYYDAEREQVLLICPPVDKIQEYVDLCAGGLQFLDIHYTTLESLDISKLEYLEELDLHDNRKLSRPWIFDGLPHLSDVVLYGTAIGPMLLLGDLPALWWLDISDTAVRNVHAKGTYEKFRHFEANGSELEDLDFLKAFPGIDYLSVTGCNLSRIPPLAGFRELKWLHLDNNPNLFLEDAVFPPSLMTLSLNDLKIRRLPDQIRSLHRLIKLHLSGLNLDALPDWLPELNLNFYRSSYESDGIMLSRTTVKDVDMSIFDQPQEVIRKWFEDRQKGDGADLNEVKVVFLGDGEAGKTHTIARLLKGGELLTPDETPDDATPGIVINDQTYDLDDRKVQVHFWDFGGQEILHSMHHIFLTERTLYVVLLNARDNTQNDRARYWLHNIKSFAGDAPVLLVLNKTDQNEHATVNISDLRQLVPNLPDAVYLSALKDSPVDFNRKLTGAMLDAIRKIDTIRTFFPGSWRRVKDTLQTMKKPYIKGDAYKKLCDDNRVEGKLQWDVLDLFKTLGVSFYYPGAKLEDYVVLRPDWITNAIYIILFNKRDEVKNGLISHETIYRLLNPREGDAVKRVLPDATYSNDEVTYVLDVVRRFRLSYLVEDGVEFIPALCGSNSLPVAAEYAADLNTLEFRMVYDYLPNNVIHRLMVELRQHLDREHVWLTGALFREKSKSFSAVVKTEGNLLRIFVRAEMPRYTADMYLDTIRAALERINGDMNLKVAENQVVYKADGIVECFDYDDLLLSQELGDTMVTSRARRKKVPIADILSQTDHRVDAAKAALIGDILSACRSLQANQIYWKAKEDDRNTYIRNILRAKGYIVADQTRSGISAGGKQAGELDLDIRREADMPWTILEALNLSGKGDSQIAYWDEHLNRLLDNYNANGLPFLLQVSYVECPKDKFGTLCTAYAEHLRFDSTAQYTGALRTAPEGYGENHFIQAYQCVYECDGNPTTVYHFFVRMGE